MILKILKGLNSYMEVENKISSEDCTILLCSCDSYEDAWEPFFKLFEKFWGNCPFEILLNTESKQYKYGNLNIRCLQKYEGKPVPYGERMIAHIREIHSPYTLVLMDDFFIRKPVQEKKINEVIEWMKKDSRAVVFSFQAIQDDLNLPSDKYKGYNLRPIYGEYKHNFQAAVWKTDYLLKSWKKHETPWEWETIGNFRTFNPKYDFYAIQSDEDSPIDYGFRNSGMGIFRGKWVLDTVADLFKNNNIIMDYSIRGVYTPADKNTVRMVNQSKFNNEFRSMKSMGFFAYMYRLIWRGGRQIRKVFGLPVHKDWLEYKRKKEGKSKGIAL